MEFPKKDTADASDRSPLSLLMGRSICALVAAGRIPLRECVGLVCGGPPCQGVSGHNMHRKKISIESDRIMEGHEK